MAQLQQFYSLFQGRFSPERLEELDGENLLHTMHSLEPDSLVYWLEFKNDDEFSSPDFGSISGGSALKYGIYKRKHNGTWMTGSPHKQTELSTVQAINVARKHRDQLIAGASLLEVLPEGSSDAEYLKFQQLMEEQAPDLAGLGRCHKYFCLLYPDKCTG